MSLLVEQILTLKNSKNNIFEIEENLSKSYSEILDEAIKVANKLSCYEQKIISVILPNSISYIEVMLGTILSGNIFNPIPYFVDIVELPKILSYVDPQILFTDRKDLLESDLEHNIELINNVGLRSELEIKKINENDIAALYYSSGTTGNPKGVLYSHLNIFSLINSICNGFNFDQDTSHLTLLPFGHTASINYNIWPSIFNKNELHISKGFEYLRSTFFQEIQNRKINYVQIVPTVAYMILKFGLSSSEYDISSLWYIGCGSSTLPLETQKQFFERYGVKVSNLYGLSETGPSHVDNPLLSNWSPGSIGVPLDVNFCKIADDGEILLKGDNVFVGYYQNQKLYDEVVQDGWFYTGDLGEEKDGVFFYKDRKKDLIIKSGINIVPSEIEEIIYGHDNVHECVVVGKEDPVYGEKIVCCVSLKGSDLNFKEEVKSIRSRCKDFLTSYKVPDQFVELKEIPKTHSGKLLRKEVRAFVNR